MQPSLIITVDTELSNFPQGQGLWGKVGDEQWGLARMLDAFGELDVRATFFLDPYAGNETDASEQRRAAELIAARGHDLQLHTHPGPAFDRSRPRLRDYSLAEQEDIIGFGCRRIESWVGRRPVLHRAGDWGADENSLKALRNSGIQADFSASAWSMNCGLPKNVLSGNGWVRVGGLLCGAGTCYRDLLTGRMRRVDLGGASFTEVKNMLARKTDPLFLTLHSFSLLRYNRSRTEFAAGTGYLQRLQRFCHLAKAQWGYQSVSALDAASALQKCADAALPWSEFPTSSIVASGAGLLKSARDRLMRYT